MRTHPPTLATLLTFAVLTACSAAGSTTTVPSGDPAAASQRSQPPLVHAAGRGLSTAVPGTDAEMAHAGRGDPTAPTDLAAPTGEDAPAPLDDPATMTDPAEVAAGLLIDLLADEGLLVTSIDTQIERDDGDRAQVRVDVAHSPGHGHPVQSRFLLELVWDAGQWQLVSYSEPG